MGITGRNKLVEKKSQGRFLGIHFNGLMDDSWLRRDESDGIFWHGRNLAVLGPLSKRKWHISWVVFKVEKMAF